MISDTSEQTVDYQSCGIRPFNIEVGGQRYERLVLLRDLVQGLASPWNEDICVFSGNIHFKLKSIPAI